MDIAPDGRRLAILTGLHVLEYARGEQETWAAALARPPRRLEIPQLSQGEALAYRRDGQALLLTSEGPREPLWQITPPSPEGGEVKSEK
jgi:hypothetical protein